ncbi:MAG: hypothetical protein AAFX39_15775 [Pseudomonadota bacterium]
MFCRCGEPAEEIIASIVEKAVATQVSLTRMSVTRAFHEGEIALALLPLVACA